MSKVKSNGLTFEDAELAPTTRTREAAPNIFAEIVSTSWDQRKSDPDSEGREIGRIFRTTLANGDVLTTKTQRPKAIVGAENMLRAAAREIGVGITIQTNDNGDGTSTLAFATRTKREYDKSGDAAPETAPENGAENAA